MHKKLWRNSPAFKYSVITTLGAAAVGLGIWGLYKKFGKTQTKETQNQVPHSQEVFETQVNLNIKTGDIRWHGQAFVTQHSLIDLAARSLQKAVGGKIVSYSGNQETEVHTLVLKYNMPDEQSAKILIKAATSSAEVLQKLGQTEYGHIKINKTQDSKFSPLELFE